jgi:hypothetical protein
VRTECGFTLVHRVVIAGEMARAWMQAVGLSVSPGLTFLTKCQNHSESFSLSTQPHTSHKTSESLGEELKRISQSKQSKKNPDFYNIIFIIKTSITAIIPFGENLHFQESVIAIGYDALTNPLLQ